MDETVHTAGVRWTLNEAFDRTSDSLKWGALRDAAAHPNMQIGGSVWVTRKGTILYDEPTNFSAQRKHPKQRPKKNADLANQLEAELTSNLRDRLVDGALVAWARTGTPTSELQPIPSSAWKNLEISSYDKSSAYHRQTSGRTNYYDVSVYPVLEAPNAAQSVVGLDLSEAFRRFVLNDPEVLALKPAAIEAEGMCREPLEIGTLRDGASVWPVKLEDETVAYWWCHVGVTILGEPSPPLAQAVQRAAEVFKSRVLALFKLLRSGRVVAIDETGIPVPRSRWKRSDTYIEFANGDMVEDKGPSGARPVFKGLQLIAPERIEQTPDRDALSEPSEVKRPGRNPKYDWDEATRYLMRVADEPDGLPETQAKRIRLLQEWFASKLNEEPATSSIKGFLKRVCHLDNHD